jgi:hypothetical protein
MQASRYIVAFYCTKLLAERKPHQQAPQSGATRLQEWQTTAPLTENTTDYTQRSRQLVKSMHNSKLLNIQRPFGSGWMI